MPTSSQTRPGFAIYGGLFLTTLSTLMYEILLTRIFSVTMWFHFAFVAVSVALFGMTVGALIVYLSPRRFPEERTQDRLYQATLLFSISIVVSFVTQLSIPFDPRWTLVSAYSIVLTYLVVSVPFVFSGISVTLVLTRFPGQISRLYAADLAGAALGTVSLIWMLDVLGDGPSAVLGVAAFAAAGGSLFAFGARKGHTTALAAVGTILLLGLAVGNAVSVQNHTPVLRVHWAKGKAEEVPLYEKWNAFSRIRITGDTSVPSKPMGWGLSTELPPEMRVPLLLMTIDATAGTVITGYDGTSGSIEHLRYDVTNVAHHIRPDADVFVIGSGGGRDVLSALLFEQASVTAVELNEDILEVVNGRYGDFSGHLDEQPGVTFVNDEARSYLARSDESYDIIQISLIDTWAATAAGAFALSENSLYTVEAWEIFLEHLKPTGVVSVSRWFHPDLPLESYRLTALAAEALRREGISEPLRHMILVKSEVGVLGASVATILVSPEPFSAFDIARILAVSNDLKFDVVLAPGAPANDPVFAAIAEADDPGSVSVGFPADISPPTDDRPFFFQMVHFRNLFDPDLYSEAGAFVTKPVFVLLSLTAGVLVLTLSCILIPAALATGRKALQGVVPLVVFFSAIGLGYLLLEVSQMQRLIVFLGHPTYALSVVLFSLLLSSGVGSLATERLSISDLRVALLLPFALLLIVLIAFGVATPAIIDRFEGATTPLRILTAVGILAPMGLMMGMPFPLGMKVASLRPNAPTAFFWGINGATSVCASVLAVTIALNWGISSAFWVGCLAYAAAAGSMAMIVARRRV